VKRHRKKKGEVPSAKARAFPKRFSPPGSAPGTLILDPRLMAAPPKLRVIDYDDEKIEEVEMASLERCRASIKDPSITWVHVQGHAEPDTLRALGEMFELHPLALEDVINRGQQPKFELYGEDFFTIFAVPRLVGDLLTIEQVCLFLGSNYVVSFYAGEEDLFEPVRKRLTAPNQKFRKHGADYLFYALADLAVDQGFPVLEQIGDSIDEIEVSLTEGIDQQLLHRIHLLKRHVIQLRRFLWPQREVCAALLRDDFGKFHDEVKIHLRDCTDHAVQLLDLAENYREMCSSLLEVYLSTVSNRLNDVMRVLTVISTIFIPLSFFVGVYGMNFDYMPELHMKLGYPAVWVVIFTTAISMLIFFRKRGWI
jgi:magnesium transporter